MAHSRIIGKIEQQARGILGTVRHVVLGLSGGADSVALLLVLKRLGLDIVAVHCNFHLRGKESDRDMDFCRNLADKIRIPLDIVHFDVPAYETGHRVSTEVACRELRYEYFRRRVEETGAERIAVAHHADDNIETMLLNLFRGCGISGLRGMLPDANGIIRPLLTTTRADILEYLEQMEQDFIVDSTNLCSDYRRNFIRNELLPLIETRWNGVRKSITSTIANLQSDEAVLAAVEEQELSGHSQAIDPDQLPYSMLKDFPEPEWLLHRWLDRYGAHANIAREIAAAMRSGRPRTGKTWRTPAGTVTATRTALRFTPTPL